MNLFSTMMAGLGTGVVGAAGYAAALRQRNMHQWLGRYYFDGRPSAVRWESGQPLRVFIAVCDHFEPEWNKPGRRVAMERVRHWVRDYPLLLAEFTDSRGRPPQHTCFFPQDEYQPEYLDALSELCRAGFADVDVHLHHDADTADGLRDKLCSFRDTLHQRHGLLRRDPRTGNVTYGFIHGNWALCNSRKDGRWCGVDQELSILHETGCYADFTLPSAPSETQTRTINRIYYAADQPGQRKSHDRGLPAKVGQPTPPDDLLMIQGPLLPQWRRRKWGVLPRIENGDLTAALPPTWERFRDWLRAGVHVAGRPDWLFVKLHTHGCKDGNREMLLGEPYRRFHADLQRNAAAHPAFEYYFVTAWEMAQLVHQAEDGAMQPDFDDLTPLSCKKPARDLSASSFRLAAAGKL